ncbi:hypothetical protein HDV03_000164 [Kappamyces sp. JEL0829]|nr:hypothetical protein HDV03_000164 [Kappamyces sp. JEL0829]
MSTVFKNDVVNSQLQSAFKQEMTPVDITRVLIIYTGGTIGMKHTDSGYTPVAGYMTGKLQGNGRFHEGNTSLNTVHVSTTEETLLSINGTFVKKVELPALVTPYSLFNKRIKYSCLEYDPLLDSSNMTMKDWVRIATDIEVNYELFDAFLILHGTDTMAYTASALSFLLENLGKTVIITGSQVPLSEVRTDAIENLLGALTIAGHFIIPEVGMAGDLTHAGLFFDNKLFRGNRSSKVNAVEFNAFESPNLQPIVNVGINIDVSWDLVWRPRRIARFKAHKILNPNVASLRLFPGITKETVQAFFSPSIAGVVLESYGSGNAPSNRPDILEIIHAACKRGVVVINCSQCKKATVSATYETGVALFNIGVVPGADMTPECALTKLTYLLGKFSDTERIRNLMGHNLRGELTIINRKQRFAYLPHYSHYASSQNILVSSVLSLLGVAHSPATPHAVDTPAFSFAEHDDNMPDMLDMGRGDSTDIHAGLEARLIPIALGHTARIGDIPTLAYLVSEFEALINVTNDDGQTSLHAAVREGHTECVTLLLRHGANVHLRDKYGRSVLMDSIVFNHPEIMRVLIQAGAHFSQDEEMDAVHYLCRAVSSNDIDRVRLLVEAGVDPNTGAQDGRTPLHLCSSDDLVDIAYYLISLPMHQLPPPVPMARVSSVSSEELAPSECRLRYTIDLEPRDRWGKTPLDYAQGNRVETVLRAALENKEATHA